MKLTERQAANIQEYLAGHKLCHGIGTYELACSIAAINLAISGELTDDIPDCMSLVIGKWIIRVQDSMPLEMINSNEWKLLLPLAAGTGRSKEAERKEIIIEWMWQQLKQIQGIADNNGFGKEWKLMCNKKTYRAAAATAYAAATADAAAYAVAYAADAADAAATATAAAATADAAAADAADAAADAADAADAAACAAYAAAAAAYAAAADADDDDDDAKSAFWEKADSIGLLNRLINIEVY